MKILVPVKRVIDYHVNVRVKPDGSGVEKDHANMSMNPFDEIALEAAIVLKEQGIACEVIVVSVGDLSVKETIRAGLALGADEGVHIRVDTALEPLNIAKLLAALAKQMRVDCVIAGKQSIDGDNSQVGQMLATLLAWPQATCACEIAIDANDKTMLQVKREVDGGTKTVKTDIASGGHNRLTLKSTALSHLTQCDESQAKTAVNRHPRNITSGDQTAYPAIAFTHPN